MVERKCCAREIRLLILRRLADPFLRSPRAPPFAASKFTLEPRRIASCRGSFHLSRRLMIGCYAAIRSRQHRRRASGAAMSMARLWRDQGKPQQARDTDAKTLLDELSPTLPPRFFEGILRLGSRKPSQPPFVARLIQQRLMIARGANGPVCYGTPRNTRTWMSRCGISSSAKAASTDARRGFRRLGRGSEYRAEAGVLRRGGLGNSADPVGRIAAKDDPGVTARRYAF